MILLPFIKEKTVRKIRKAFGVSLEIAIALLRFAKKITFIEKKTQI